MRRGWAAAIALLTLLAAGPAAAAAAPMTAPVELGSGYVLDDADVLTAADETRAQQRLEQFRAQTELDLWVVFVDDFADPSSSEQWANQVAESNGLGPTQYLLAVAVEGRQYYLSGDSSGPVTGDQLGAIEQQLIQPQLQAENWLGAIDAAASGLADAARGGTGGGSDGDAGGGTTSIILIVVVVLAVIGIVIWLIVRSRRKARVGGDGAQTPAEQVSTEDLERQAGSALVETDDAIKTSEEELGFARAQFGDAAATEFAAALEAAKESLNQAFHLKQKLEDTTPDTEAEVRSWNAQIVRLCRDASAMLDEKAAAFDELRKLEQNAPEALARVQEVRTATEPRIAQAQATLAALATRFAPTALATIADNPAQARQRLAFADEQLAAAQDAIGAGDGGQAAVGIRAAEEAVDQAGLLSDAVGKLGDDLAKAEGSIKELVANLQQDVAAASALPDDDGRLAPVIASTRQAISSATAAAAAPQLAPLQVLESLDAANTQIDTLIAGVRDQQQAAQRAQQQLGQLVMQAQAQVSAAEDYITARRGAVGADARTRLAEAGASLVQARQLHASDPQQAVAYAQRANQLAGQAIQLAQSDVGAFSGGGMGGMFSGSGGGGGGGNILGAVLGGIVINSMLGGGGGGRRGSSRGGGMFGGGGGFGGGRSPGSFGGGATRGRRGGGRF